MPFPPRYQKNLRNDGSLYPGYMGESVDLSAGRFETGPLAHTATGGIRINAQCEASVPGLYAAGGVVGGIYGHARPEGFTVMITLVFGRRAGLYAARAAKAAGEVELAVDAVEASRDRAARVAGGLGDEGLKDLRTAIAATMTESAWVIKDEAGLRRGLEQIRELAEGERRRTAGPAAEGGPVDGFAWNKALEVPNLLLCAEMLLMGAIERKESRGAFFRADYPKTDNERWLKNITHRQVDGWTVMDTVPVDLRYCGPESLPAVDPKELSR
jgi:succinate dehydrogenase / fumarate reductase flavoprotein subunit